MKKSMFAVSFLLVFFSVAFSAEIENVSPRQAYEMLKKPGIALIDVRSIAEYYLVGHPVEAVNVPYTFWSERDEKFVLNENFSKDIQRKFRAGDGLIFMCRSGGRSLKAAREISAAGFTRVFNVEEGFEGELDARGYRTVGGWKNSGLPYTYEIDREKIYHFLEDKPPDIVPRGEDGRPGLARQKE
jgi:rhodanese-related sulfurtransferase